MPPAEQLYAENIELKLENGQLRAQINWLKKRLFGGGQSEKLDRTQLILALGQLEEADQRAKQLEKVAYERERNTVKSKKERDQKAFENLPVSETIIIDPEEVKASPQDYEKIGEERTEELDITPPRLIKRVYIRPKYRRRHDRSAPPKVAPAPARPVAGGYASAGLIAYIIISKYENHLPLRRLERMSGNWGMQIPAQNMVDWIRMAADWLTPIYNKLKENLRKSGYIQIDETPVRCNDPDQKRGGTTQSYLWVMGTPGGDVIFTHKPNRAHEHATTLLGENYQGLLQSDAYKCYPDYVRNHPNVIGLGCFAHARRHFYEAQAENPKLNRVALKLISRLYQYERDWDEKGIPHDHVRAWLRTTHYARPLRWLKTLATKNQDQVLPQTQTGKAITYLLNQWETLTAHTRHGHSRLDNNLIENAIRPSAVGKKNWLFIGHPEAGQRTAILYSIVISCRRQGKDPLAYLRDMLTRLPKMTNQDDLTPLLPANWHPQQSKSTSGPIANP